MFCSATRKKINDIYIYQCNYKIQKNNFLLIAKLYQLDIISVSSKKKTDKKEMTLCSQIIQLHTDEKKIKEIV